MAELCSDGVLHTEVFLELIVILDYLVPPTLQIVDEGTCALLLICFTVVVKKEIGAVFGGTK